MNSQSIRHLDTLKRIAAFGTAHVAEFPAASQGGQLFASIATALPELDGFATGQASAGGAARAGTSGKAAATAALHDALAAINQTAHALAAGTPGLDQKFRMPRSAGNQALLNAARAFATDAAPLKDKFTALELPADFLEHLAADIAALETALAAQKSGQSAQAGATAGMDDTLHNALAAARTLGAIVRNKCRNDVGTLAEWTTASHIERAPRAAKPAAQPVAATAAK